MLLTLDLNLASSLNPSSHIDMICCKALKTLGFVMRVTKEFSLNNTVKTLYCALVRPILEYGSLNWDPYSANVSCQLKRVQRKFLKYASFILGIQCPPHDYTPVSKVLDLKSLADRRRMLGKTFLRGLLSNLIDSPTLLSLINFRVPPLSTRTPMLDLKKIFMTI